MVKEVENRPAVSAENQSGSGGALACQAHQSDVCARHLNKSVLEHRISTVRCRIRKSIIWWMRLISRR